MCKQPKKHRRRNVGQLLGASESPDALSIAEDRIASGPRVQRAPGVPHALSQEGGKECAKLGRHWRRENASAWLFEILEMRWRDGARNIPPPARSEASLGGKGRRSEAEARVGVAPREGAACGTPTRPAKR